MRPRTYLHAVWNSISRISYYQEVLQAPISFSVRFFLLSYLVIGLLSATTFVWHRLPVWQTQLETSFTELQQHFPSELEVRWDTQKLSSNATQPIEVQYPSWVNVAGTELPTLLLIIDPSATDPQQAIEHAQKSSLFVVTQTELFSTGSVTASSLPLASIPSFEHAITVNQHTLPELIQTWRQEAQDSIKFIQWASFGFFPTWLVIGRSITILLDTVLVFYILQLLGLRFPFKRVWQLLLHFAVVAGLLEALNQLLLPKLGWDMFGFAFWGYTIVVLWQLRSPVRTPKA